MGLDDARNDAAVILLGMRDRWVDERAAHLSEDRCERLVVAWARLRLIDQYRPQFEKQKRVINYSPDEVGADGVVDPKSIRRLSDLDNREIGALIDQLTEKQRTVVRGLLYDGKTQVELAGELGVSQTAISTTFNRAHDALTNLLASFQFDKE